MRKASKVFLCVILSIMILASSMPLQSFAQSADDDKPSTLKTATGEIQVDDTWKTQYPYGCFAFSESEAVLSEGGGAVEVTVYRLGGTYGRVTAFLAYNPTVTPGEKEGEYGYLSALSTDDVEIEAEDASPAARYDPIGKDPDPEESGTPVRKTEDGDDWVMTAAIMADKYQWQVEYNGRWKDIKDENAQELRVSKTDYEGFDVRCVYTVGGVSYSTDTANGKKYVRPEEEILPEMPADLELSPEPTFTKLVPAEGDDPYQGYEFPLTFADGEWEKKVRFTPKEDSISECLENAVLIIADHEGGAVNEAAGSMNITMTDNDPAEPFEIGLTEKEGVFDKAKGKAEFTVRRTGGCQEPVSVVCETADGTAKKGIDYVAVSKEIPLYGDVREITVEIPLIDDGVKSDKEKSFTLRITGVKGDSEGLCTLLQTEATVRLYHSGTGEKKNLATALRDGDAINLADDGAQSSSAADISPGTVSGAQYTPEPVKAQVTGRDSTGGLRSYRYPDRLVFEPRDYRTNDYWKDYVTLSDAGCSFQSHTNVDCDGVTVTTTASVYGKAIIPVNYMTKLYSGIDGSCVLMPYKRGGLCPWIAVGNTQNASSFTPEDYTGYYCADKSTSMRYQCAFTMAQDLNMIIMGFVQRTLKEGSFACGVVDGSELGFNRRVFSSSAGFYMTVHTANDGDSGSGNVPTAPDGAPAYHADSTIYPQLMPDVSIVPHNGGVPTSGGQLYVGSQLRISLKSTDTYEPLVSKELSTAVYLTDDQGNIVKKATKGDDSNYYLTLVWDGMTQADLSKNYSINVIMTRKQTITLDLSPSIPRGDDGMTPDMNKASDAVSAFLNNVTGSAISYGVSQVTNTAPYFSGISPISVDLRRSTPPYAVKTGTGSLNLVLNDDAVEDNIQWVNFNCRPEDLIVYNGKAYKGNEQIWLALNDLSCKDLHFYYYAKEFLSIDSIMNTSIDKIAVYLDADADGRIAGSLDEATGYFVIDDDSKDRLITYLEPDKNYSETDFTPEKDVQGRVCQYFLKIYYYMNPRSLQAPSGNQSKAQVLPAFTTSITDSENYFALTQEQQNYRYLISGTRDAGQQSYTSDGHLMYGVEATALQYVDVPMGGDTSPPECTDIGGGKSEYTWTPAYIGSLLFPYTNPEPIYIEKSVAGANIPLAPYYHQHGSFDAAGTDVANLNGYLGSFAANSTVALCVREQKNTVAEIIAGHLKNDVPDESSTLISNQTIPDPRSTADAQTASDHSASFNTADGGNDYPALNVSMMPYLDKLRFNAYFVNFAKKGDELILGISLPLKRWSNNSSKGKKVTGFVDSVLDDANKFADAFRLFSSDPTKKLNAFDSLSPGFKDARIGRTQFYKFSAALTFYAAFHWKYDHTANKFNFVQFVAGVTVSISGQAIFRWPSFPFVYFTITASLSLNVGLGTYHEVIYEENPIITIVDRLHKGETRVIKLSHSRINITFAGQVGLSLYSDEACTQTVENSKTGQLTSNSDAHPLNVTMMRSLAGEPKTYYLKIAALKDTRIYRLAEVTDTKDHWEWNGVEITPSICIELAAALDFAIVKLEAAVRVSLGCTMLLFRKGKTATDFMISSVDFRLALILRATLLFFNYEFTLAGYNITYNGTTNIWTKKFVTDFKPSTNKSAGRRGIDYDAALALPDDATDTQRVYKQQETAAGLRAFNPNDVRVPFELSGYSSSSDAAKLADGLMSGTGYQVVTLKTPSGENVNYVLYHISRDAQNTIDNSMLVLSELRMTGVTPGLLNPVDENASVPYIPVEDDGTGDLDFHIAPSPDGGSLTVTWTDYQSTTAADAGESIDTFAGAVKNTRIKSATFTRGQTQTSFTDVATVSEDTDEYVGMPITTDDATVFVRANHIGDDELDQRTRLYSAYLAGIGYNIEDVGSSDRNKQSNGKIAQYRLSTQRAIWVQSGGSSDICVKAPGIPESCIVLEDGATVQNIDAKKIGDACYIVYTTRRDDYTDENGNILTGEDYLDADGQIIPGRIANMLSVKRLYLRTFTVADGRIVWGMDGKAVLLRTLYDYDNGGKSSDDPGSLPDGVYANGSIIENKNDPYFTNLQFLNAKLGDSLTGTQESFPLLRGAKSADTPEEFLLFDMNGSTYLIRQDSLESMTGSGIVTDTSGNSTTTGTIIPFFRPDTSQSADNGVTAGTGRLHTTIGADGDGNLVAVYTSSVQNTSDTALCISKYDPNTGWGSKTILAMNHLSVYEDNEKLKRTGEAAEKAFLGLLDSDGDGTPDADQKGSLDQFVFSEPQIALGNETVTDSSGVVTQKPTLLVLAQGCMTYLESRKVEIEGGDRIEQVLPVSASDVNTTDFPRSRNAPAGTGIYAIAYGVGTQAVGKASLYMDTYDFGAGSDEQVTIGFENTGDIGIRGSEDQPITVSLMASDYSEPLAQWKITENIVPGQKASLTGILELKATLPVGTSLFLNVEEDPYYEQQGGTPFDDNSGTILTIEEKPELSFSDTRIAFDSVDGNGSAVIDVEFRAGNRGTARAEEVKAVFSYDTGTVDANGSEVFVPLDLTDSHLSVRTEGMTGGESSADPTKGELDLRTIDVGYGQHVRGTLTVPPEWFREKTTNALNLRIELFSKGDEALPAGEHHEYNSADNVLLTQIEHAVIFNAPARITLPAGNELRIPIDCKYSTGEETPHILVTEFPDLDGYMHFGAHAFRYGVFDDGSGNGVLELKAESEGSGYIRIKDLSTNSYYDIAYHITAPEPGIKIYKDNNIFEFRNQNGDVFSGTEQGVQDWFFMEGVNAWGADGSAPYLGTLSRGVKNSSFTFRTVAESIDLVFDGEVSAVVDTGGPVTLTAAGGDGSSGEEYASLVLGRNLENISRTVTVTVTGGTATDGVEYAYFDRLIEHYNLNQLPIPDDDQNPPAVFFSRSFPGTASIAAGNRVELQAFVFDETGIASVSMDSQKLTSVTRHDVKFWSVDLSFGSNGVHTLALLDDMGNRTTHTINVDWFDSAAQSGASAVPEVSARLMKRGSQDSGDAPLTDDTDFSDDDLAYILPSGKTSDASGDPDYEVTQITVTQRDGLITCPTADHGGNEYPATANGWYLVKAIDPGSDGEIWSATVVDMMRLTQNQLIIAADPKKAHPGDALPALTYRTWGLLPGDSMSGALERQSGDSEGVYAITRGSLTPRFDYKIFFEGADYVIGHDYGEPVWSWSRDADRIVTIDVTGLNTMEIHPGWYSINGGEQIAMDSATTQYVFTGTSTGELNQKLLIHSSETAAAEYHICFSDLILGTVAGDFAVIGGTDPTVNLTIANSAGFNNAAGGSLDAVDCVFSRDPASTGVATIFMSAETAGSFVFSSVQKTVIAEGIAFRVIGACTADETAAPPDGHSAAMVVSGTQDTPDPFGATAVVSMSFTCTTCGSTHQETAIVPLREVIPAGCLTDRTVTMTAKTVVDDVEYADVRRIEFPGTALGHTYGEPAWTWAEDHSGAEAAFTCVRCGDTQTVTASSAEHEHVAAGCETNAYEQYTAAVTFGGREYTGEDRITAPGTATGHHYDDPTWQWTSCFEVVGIELSDWTEVSIHPTYYEVNGQRTAKDCSHTMYVFSGSVRYHGSLLIHDYEAAPAAYYICFDGLALNDGSSPYYDPVTDRYLTYDSKDFVVVNGNGATVNLTLRNNNSFYLNNQIFAAGSYITGGSPDLDDPIINIAAQGVSSSSFNTHNAMIAGDYIRFTMVGEPYKIFFKDVSEFPSTGQATIITTGESADPFAAIYSAQATFTCFGCGKTVTLTDDHPVFGCTDPTCTMKGCERYKAKVTFEDRDYTDENKLREKGDPSGHRYAAVWSWSRVPWDVVTIDLSSNMLVEIYPTYYKLNDSDPIEKDSSRTRYVFTTGQQRVEHSRLRLYAGENAPTVFNLCFSDLSIDVSEPSNSFVYVSGNNAAVNLTLSGTVSVTSEESVFMSQNAAAFYIGAEGACRADFSSVNGHVADSNTAFRAFGEIGFEGIGSLDELSSSAGCAIVGAEGNPDPFKMRDTAVAELICSRCSHRERVDAVVVPGFINGRSCRIATAVFSGSTYTGIRYSGYFVGHSISLNGSIGLNCYLDVPDDPVSQGKVKVDFSWSAAGNRKTHSVTLTPQDKTDAGYRASCPLAVAEMTCDVTAVLTLDGVVQGDNDIYSVKRYADVILSEDYARSYNGEKPYADLQRLVQTMLDYGAKAQLRFDRNTDYLANEGTDFFTGEETIPFRGDHMNQYLSDCGLEYVGTSVVYLSNTTLRHYYRVVDASKFTDEIKNAVTFGGKPAACKEKDGMIYFDKKGIAASQFDTSYTLRINGHDYGFSALDYSALSAQSDFYPYRKSIAKQLAAAIYRYNQAANAYFND